MSIKTGCFIVYSIILILIGMGIYKYRAEIMSMVSDKYNEVKIKAVEKINTTVDKTKDNLQINNQ